MYPAPSGENHTFIITGAPQKTPKLGPMIVSRLKSCGTSDVEEMATDDNF